MVDTRDLKSLGRIGRAGSIPAAGTKYMCFVAGYAEPRLTNPFGSIISLSYD